MPETDRSRSESPRSSADPRPTVECSVRDDVRPLPDDTRIERYRFSPEILQRVRNCYSTDNLHGPWELAENWLVIVMSAWISIVAWRHFPISISLPLYLIAVILIGGRLRALADILHQAAHLTLLKNRTWNAFLGTFCSGYLVLQSFSGYRMSHVRCHHGRFADRDLDPDYVQYQKSGLCGKRCSSDSVRRYLRHLVSPPAMLSYLQYLVTNRILPKAEDPRERLVRLSFLIALAALVVYFGWTGVVLAYWVVPLVTTAVWIGAFIEVMEHFPMIETAPRIDIYMARNRDCSRLMNLCMGLQQYEGYHIVHHKFPRVPQWRNEEVHTILMDDDVYRSLNRVRGWPNLLRDVLTFDKRLDSRLASR